MEIAACELCEQNNPYYLLPCPHCHYLMHVHVATILEMPFGGTVSTGCQSCGYVMVWKNMTPAEIMVDIAFNTNGKPVKHEPY